MRFTIDIDKVIEESKARDARSDLGLHVVLAGETVEIDEQLIERVSPNERNPWAWETL